MQTKEYDIMSGKGLAELKKDLRKVDRQLKRAVDPIRKSLADTFISEVTTQSSTIYNRQMRNAVAQGNVAIEDGNTTKVVNLTQHATYSEFGTGTIGEGAAFHPMAGLTWEHNVKGREPGQGWVYEETPGSKTFWYTEGVAANPIYYTSMKYTISQLPRIGREEIAKVLKL